MRILIIFLISLLTFSASFSQVWVNRAAPTITAVDSRIKASLNLIIPVLADTSLMGQYDSLGCVLQVRSTGIVYIRDTNLIGGGHKWSKLGGADLAANNGLSVAGGNVVLGQDYGDVTNPAALTSVREIPVNNFGIILSSQIVPTAYNILANVGLEVHSNIGVISSGGGFKITDVGGRELDMRVSTTGANIQSEAANGIMSFLPSGNFSFGDAIDNGVAHAQFKKDVYITDSLLIGKASNGSSADSVLVIRNNSVRKIAPVNSLSKLRDSTGIGLATIHDSLTVYNTGVGGVYDSTIYVYPGDTIQRKYEQLKLIPSGSRRLVVMPGLHVLPTDTLNSVLYIDTSDVVVEFVSGAHVKIADSSNAPIDTIEINTNYGPQVGLNDIQVRAVGPLTNNVSKTIIISSTGSPNQFTINFTSPTNITGDWQAIGDGFEIKFTSLTGHTLNDRWTLITSSTPASIVRIGQGFQTDTIKNVYVIGMGLLDGNAARQYPVNVQAAESNYNVGVFGRVSNVLIQGLTITNNERAVMVAGRNSGTFQTNGGTTGGAEFNTYNVRLVGLTTYNNDGGVLIGHPSYRGFSYRTSVLNNNITSTSLPAIEPNYRCSNWIANNNKFRNTIGGLAVHFWRGPTDGYMYGNLTEGTFSDNAPGGWITPVSVNVDAQYQPIFRVTEGGAFTAGEGVEIIYNASSNVGTITNFDRTASTYGQLLINANPIVMATGAGAPTSQQVGIGLSATAAKLHVLSGTFPVVTEERTNNSTNAPQGVSRILATTSGDMAAGYGAALYFAAKDNAGVTNNIAALESERENADNTGGLLFTPFVTGTRTPRMQLRSNGVLNLNNFTNTRIGFYNNRSMAIDKDSVIIAPSTAGMYIVLLDTTATADSNVIKRISPSSLGLYLTGGSRLGSMVESSAASLTLTNTNVHYVFTGSSPTTWTLPDRATNPNQIYFIKNAGSADITLTRAGSDQVYDVSAVTSITISAGAARIIVSGTTYWYAE